MYPKYSKAGIILLNGITSPKLPMDVRMTLGDLSSNKAYVFLSIECIVCIAEMLNSGWYCNY